MRQPGRHRIKTDKRAVHRRYEVGEQIATGGMGTVHRAYDRLAQRPVAYKRLKVASEAARARAAALFQLEYETLAHLAHPGIVEVYDFGFDEFGPFYAMELLTGKDLVELAPVPLAEGCGILRAIASALALLHGRRLLHRDVSPPNVRLTGEGRAKLLDFGGLAHFGTPTAIVGTPAFLAPECLTRAPLDARADLYGLGALAYWLFTRRTHVRARTLDALPEAWAQPIVPPSQLAPELPPALDDLVLSLLEPDRIARPAGAAEVIERLTSIADLPPEEDEARIAQSYLTRPPLCAREQPIQEIQHALRHARAGLGRVIVVEGERGVGRSALLDRFAVDAQLAGATVLRAQGGTQTTGFAVARQLVKRGFALFPEIALSLPEAGGMLRLATSPSGAKAASRSPSDAAEQHASISTALSEALLRLTHTTPIILLIDDAQVADAESIALFASMLDAIRRHSVLLVLATTGSDAGAGSRGQAWARLEAHAAHHRLAPLAPGELDELVASTFGGAPGWQQLSAWLHAQTGGNPAHALELTRAMLTAGRIRYRSGTFTLPHDYAAWPHESSYAAASLARLAGLDATAGEVMRVLALHGGALGTELIAKVTDKSPRKIVRTLEELGERGAVVRREDRFACASESLRAAVRRSLSEDAQRGTHRALARALAEQQPGSLEERLTVAGHLLGAGGDEALEGALMLAQTGDAQRFELAMNGGALPLLERALGVLQQHGLGDDECVGLLVPLSLSGFYGRLEAQRRYLDRTLHALSELTGLLRARRLRRRLGATLALWLGMLVALCAQLFTVRKVNRRSFRGNLEALISVVGPATAAAASTYDSTESFRITSWLSPLSAAPKQSGLYLMREFCLATAELSAGSLRSASARYSEISARFQKPVMGVDDVLREQASLGCLHGQAQALATEASPQALPLAEELVRRGQFYAPHVECVRMTYHANRGEGKRAALHRERAETFGFQGGIVWSAMTVLTVRSIQAAVLTGDAATLVRVAADLEGLSALSPSLSALHELALAHLDVLRGHPDRAIPIYERVLATRVARDLASYPLECAMHAQALIEIGAHTRARELCVALIAELEGGRRDYELAYRLPRQKLALALAGLGEHARAAELLDECFTRGNLQQNPLALGALHRDRAHVAALARDETAFAMHAEAMERYFRTTENPYLLQQCARLQARAAQLGLPGADLPNAQAPEALDLEGQTVIGVETAPWARRA